MWCLFGLVKKFTKCGIKNAPAENVLIIILQLVSGLEAAEFYSRVSMIQVIGTILFEIILGTYFNHSIKFRFRYGQISQSYACPAPWGWNPL